MVLVITKSANAYDFSYTYQGQTLYYNIVNGNAEVTKQNRSTPTYNTYPTGNLVIPSSVTNGDSTYNVTSIGYDAFCDCIGLTSVTIPNSVTNIGSFSFDNCSGLTSVTIPNSVTSIRNYAFRNCSGLTSVTIPNSVTSIGNHAFENCSGLTSVTIPNSVTIIDYCAFYGCSGLTSVTIPNSVASLGEYAFAYCSGLTSVTIPNSVTSIGYQTFAHCSGLTSITIPNSVTSINYSAFYGCSGLTSVTIPNSVTSIGDRAFEDCSSLTSVTIPNSVTSIGKSAFAHCSGLTSVTIPNSVTSIGEWVFAYCSGLTSVTIPNSVTSIGVRAFKNCSGLTSVTIPNSVTSIGNHAFENCSGLTSVTIPNSVTGIGECAFSGCIGLTSVNFNATNCTTMGSSCYPVFSGCTNLTTLNIGENVTKIPGAAFSGCSSLTTVNYTGTIAQWCGIYFGGSDANPTYYSHTLSISGSPLTNLVIPEGVTEIKRFTFYNCSGLTSVTIPNSVTSIGECAFAGCSGLTSMIVENDNTYYDSRGNCNAVIKTSTNTLMVGCKNTIIPNSVTGIGNSAFAGCIGLTSVTIPDSVTSIGECAFSACIGLTSVNFNATNCTTMGSSFYPVFSGCTNLATLNIGENVIKIPGAAFYGCSGLTTVTIPNSVTRIHGAAFYGCSGLTEITSLAITAPTLESNAFGEVSSTIPVYIPCGNMASYQTTWSYFSNILTPDPNISINVGVTDSTFGVSNVTDGPTCDSTAVIEAVANYGYHFTQWNDGNTDNPRAITLTQDTTFVANFALNQYTLTVQSNNESIGTIIGEGTYNHLDTVVITATPIDHHHMVCWNDGNRDNPRQVVIVCDTAFTAIFAIDTHTVSAVANEVARGTVTGSGNYAYGTACTLTAIPHEGYQFLSWGDGNTENPRVVTVTGDITYTAFFESTTQGVTTVDASEISIYSTEGQIVVRGAEGMEIRVFDAMGRMLVQTPSPLWGTPPNLGGELGWRSTFEVPASGVYLVKIGDAPARKVVVIR